MSNGSSSTITGQPRLQKGRHGAEGQQCYPAADEVYNGMSPSTAGTAPMI